MTPDECYRTYVGYLRRTLPAYLPQHLDVEDAIQDAFIGMLNVWSTLTDDGIRNYWWKAAYRAARRNGHTRGGRPVLIESIDDDSHGERRALIESLTDERMAPVPPADLNALLAPFSPQQRQVLLMRALDFSYAEIAEQLGTTPYTVGTILTRVRWRVEGLTNTGRRSPRARDPIPRP